MFDRASGSPHALPGCSPPTRAAGRRPQPPRRRRRPLMPPPAPRRVGGAAARSISRTPRTAAAIWSTTIERVHARASRPTARSHSRTNASAVSRPLPWLPMRDAPMARPVAAGVAQGPAQGPRAAGAAPAGSDEGLAPPETKQVIPEVSRYRPIRARTAAAAACRTSGRRLPVHSVRPLRRDGRARRASRARTRTAIRRRCSWPRPTTGASQMAVKTHAANIRARATPSCPAQLQAIALRRHA